MLASLARRLAGRSARSGFARTLDAARAGDPRAVRRLRGGIIAAAEERLDRHGTRRQIRRLGPRLAAYRKMQKKRLSERQDLILTKSLLKGGMVTDPAHRAALEELQVAQEERAARQRQEEEMRERDEDQKVRF
jgi:hypothetical protein